jgi:hypothetical protein
VAGAVFTVMASVCAVELPQELLAVTEIFPLVVLAVAVMLLLVLLPLHPPGNVQVYDVAPATAVMEYVFDEPEQIVVVPEILPGVVGGVLTVIARVCAVELPQELLAVTEIFPLVVLAVAVMLLLVLLPLHPPGNVHV